MVQDQDQTDHNQQGAYSALAEQQNGFLTASLVLAFDFLLAPQTEGFTSGASSTSELAVINWNQVVLYPAGPACDSLLVLPRLVLPKGWQYGTALETEAQSGDTVSFTAVSLTTLVDSPVLTGAHVRRIDVSADSAVRHTINIAADGEAALR